MLVSKTVREISDSGIQDMYRRMQAGEVSMTPGRRRQRLVSQMDSGCKGTVASARRSGQGDFQRGTPPVSLASCSIGPFLRARIITE